MIRYLLSALLGFATASLSLAHFVFVVPDKDGKSATVVFSDSLEPDEAVTVEKIAGIKLTAKLANGKTAPVTTTADKHSLKATLPEGARAVFGSVVYGALKKGDTKPFLLMYHPKAVRPGTEEKETRTGSPAELVPFGGPGKLGFLLLAHGKPVADVEVTVMLPDGKKEKVKTDKDGKTSTFAAEGQYGAWARISETKSGEEAGQKYEELRHYATLVCSSGK